MYRLIAEKWKFYLSMMQLDESTMSAQQVREQKLAFYGGWGIFLRELQNTAKYPRYKEMEAMEAEISEFLEKECAEQEAAGEPKPAPEERPTFARELTDLVNRYSQENGSNTPDFILAGYIYNSIAIFDHAVNAREQWYGRGAGLPATEEARESEKRADEIRASRRTSTIFSSTPEIKEGLIFKAEAMPGKILQVKSVNKVGNQLAVRIYDPAKKRGWVEDGWDLKHTIWGFERGEYWKAAKQEKIPE